MLDTLILILTLLLKAASLWFLAVALFALRKPKRYAVCAPRTRFACLVAARNEEAVIGALVESLKKQDYPDALYDIFVIPNNCTDDTESEALCAGAKIFRCFEPVRCKGDALHEAVAWLCSLPTTACGAAGTTPTASLTRTTSRTSSFSPA